MRVVIVGGVAAGMSAATRLRRLDETAEIVVLEAGAHVSFANCGLPYHVGGVIEDRSKLLRDTAAMAQRYRLDIRTRSRVLRIDRAARRVLVRSEGGERTDEHYDVLVLAPGAIPSRLPSDASVPVHALRTVEDMDAIVAALAGGARRAVVVGGGYIGLEAVENLVARGVATTLVVRGDQVLHTLDVEMVTPVHAVLREHGVALRFGAGADRVESGAVVLVDGERLPADLVIDATGGTPDTALAAEAGLGIGATGGISVDERHRTSDPVVFAAGDAVEKTDAVDSSATLVALAGLANRHGRAIADVIAGEPVVPEPALRTAIVGVFGLQIGTLGWTEARLRRSGRGHRVVHATASSHAAYYPGAQPMALKLLVDAVDDRILGAQVVGRDGVDKRIDVIATAAAGGITASGLSRLELAYAPQFGAAKDPVNLLGYVAENVARGVVRSVQWHEVAAREAAGAVVVDVRTPEEFAKGHIPGSVNLPVDEVRDRHDELPDAPLVVTCQVGQRGFNATRILTQLGHDAENLDGGWVTWRDAHPAD